MKDVVNSTQAVEGALKATPSPYRVAQSQTMTTCILAERLCGIRLHYDYAVEADKIESIHLTEF